MSKHNIFAKKLKKQFLSINDLITAVEKLGTVYSVVALVLVKSAFLFTKLFAIMLKRKPPPLIHLLSLVEKMCLIL